MSKINITIVQANLVWEDVNANLLHLTELLKAITATDILVLPEMFATGFSMNANALAKDCTEKGIAFMQKTAAEKNCIVCGSLIFLDEGKHYNRFIWMPPDGKLISYNKRHLFTPGDEGNHYIPGNERVVIGYKGWKIRPLICYDLRFPVWSRNNREDPYDLLLYVANWPEKRIAQWGKLLQARAIENCSYAIGVNRIGVDGNGYAYTGNSMCVDFRGEPEMLEENHEIVRTFTLDQDPLNEYRLQLPFLKDADYFEIK